MNTHRDHALTLLEHYFAIAGVAVTGDVREELGECVDAIIAASGREASEAIDARLAELTSASSHRIIQIAGLPSGDPNQVDMVLALDVAGRLWLGHVNVHLPDWKQLPPLPGAVQTLPTGGL